MKLIQKFDPTDGKEYLGKVKLDELESGIADARYIHEQIVPASTWAIQHNLGKYPSVTIVDSAGNVQIGDVEYVDTNNLTVSFTGSFGGRAYLN
jgi:hypothetical protein